MEFWLQQNSDKFQLPVKPSDYTVSVAHKNTVVNVIQVGDVNLIGNLFFQQKIITLAIMQGVDSL